MNYLTDEEKVSFNDTVRAGMNVITGEEFRKNFIAVSSMASENLSRTLGPYAHTTLIDDGSSIYSTKDGWNIVNRMQFGDGIQNALYGMIKDVSFQLVSTVGDGTTTAIVASNAMIQKLSSDEYKDLTEKSRQRDVLESMHRVKDTIKKYLESPKYLHLISSDNDYEDIYKIAMISSNENENIANIIRKIYCETNNPNIHVDFGSGRNISYAIQVGYRLECKPKNLNAFINHDGDVYKGINVYTLFFDHNVTYTEHLEIIRSVMELASETKTQFLLFAPYFDDIITGAIAEDMNRYIRAGQLPSLFPIQVPLGGGSTQKYFFEDSAMITKSMIFGAENLKHALDIAHPRDEEGRPVPINNEMRAQIIYELKNYIKGFMGYCTSAIASENYVIFEEFDKESPIFVNTFNAVKKLYEEEREKAAKDMSPLNREYMNISMRFVRLTGAMGIIHVGAESELERRCVKDSVDDAVLACRSAFTHGYVAGMNIATIGAACDAASDEQMSPMDQRIALLIADVFRQVTYEVMKNKYPDSNPELDYLWDVSSFNELFDVKHSGKSDKETAKNIISICVSNGIGYDIVNERFYKDDLKVINSVRTDIEIIGAMMSIVTHALTSNQMLSLNRKFDKEVGKKMIRENDLEKYSTMMDGLLRVINQKGIYIKSFLEDE